MSKAARFIEMLQWSYLIGLPQPLITLIDKGDGIWELEYRGWNLYRGWDLSHVDRMAQAGAQIEQARRNHGIRVRYRM